MIIAVLCPKHSSGQSAPVRTLVPDLTIDGQSQMFSSVQGIHVAANGTIFVRQPGDFAITAFSPSGALIRKFARKGSGPGEAQAITSSGLIGDSLWVADLSLRRITIFDLDGNVVRTIAAVGGGEWLKTVPPSKDFLSTRLLPFQLLPDNVALGVGMVPAVLFQEGKVSAMPILRMDWEGVANGVVANRGAGHGMFSMPRDGRQVVIGQHPFTADPKVMVSPDGKHIAIVDVKDGASPTIRITYVSTRGDTLRRSEVPFTPLPIDKATLDSVIGQLVKAAKMPGGEATIREALLVPKYNWPIGQTLLEPNGTAWIQIRANTPVADWLIVSPAGKLVEIVKAPRQVDIRLVKDGIWAVVPDEDDVPSVIRYRRK
jgi:hypothetical protein